VAARGDAAPRLLVVGRNSFLAEKFLGVMPRTEVRAVRHDEIDQAGLLDGTACVVNFARHPLLGRDGYEPDGMDPDLRLARALGDRPVAYVMLSSRKVYAPGRAPLVEDAPLGPTDAYGRHKLEAEERLRALLGERLTILRLANVFGYERIPGRRTFLSIALDRLRRERRIVLDMSPFVPRDFLPVEACARIFARIAERPPGGVLNVGSGIGLPTGMLALWIIEGYGRGKLVVESPEEKDPFVLGVGRLTGLYGPPTTLDEIRASCLTIGRRLEREQAPE
jgi:dTDP-4-dehydrorhamnose reductase/UDP-glucose 4-epimerase